MDTLNDIFYNVIRRIKSLENRPRYSGESWTFGATWKTPAENDVQNAGVEVIVDWDPSSVYIQDGIHVDPLDTTKLIIENPGRYLLQWLINPGVIQPMLGPLLHVPLDAKNTGPWANFHLSLPAMGAYGSFTSNHYPSNATWLDPVVYPTDASIQFSVKNDDLSSNQVLWRNERFIQIDYLGPIPGPPFVVPP